MVLEPRWAGAGRRSDPLVGAVQRIKARKKPSTVRSVAEELDVVDEEMSSSRVAAVEARPGISVLFRANRVDELCSHFRS